MNDDRKIQYLPQQQRNMNVHVPTSVPTTVPTSTRITANKSSESASKLQYISQEELLSLFEQNKGSQYFIPEGFEPVLIPRGSPLQPVANLLQNGKNLLLKQQQQQLKYQNQNAAAPDVVVVNKQNMNQTNTSSSDVRFPHLVLARSTAPTPPRGSVTKAQKPKKPPRPPNAFILYRRSKQPDIVAKNEGISNNEVSKQVGEMWHKEPLEEKLKFQRMADAAKMEHMKKYPEYKYRPRRPHEKRRRTKRPSLTTNNNNNNNINVNTNTNTTNNNINNNNNNNDNVGVTINNDFGGGMDTINSISTNNDFSFLQQQLERRTSIDTVSTIDQGSRRNSEVSCGEFSCGEYGDEIDQIDQLALFEEPVPPLADDIHFTSPNPHGYGGNVCVETTAFDLLMEGVSPGNDSEVNPFEFFNMEYSDYFNPFDLSLMSSPNDQMMTSCDNIDA